MARRERSAWCLAALALTLMLRSLARLEPVCPGNWQGLALSSILLSLLLAAWVSMDAETVVARGVWLLLMPLLCIFAWGLDCGIELLPKAIVARDYPPGDWAHWPYVLLALGAVSVFPKLRKFRQEEWVQYQALLPVLLFLSLAFEGSRGRFHLPPAIAVEAWCELGVLVLARTSLKNESFGKVPMFLVMAVIPSLMGLWVSMKVTGSQDARLWPALGIGACTTGLTAAVMAVLLREEVERRVTRLFSPNLRAAQERALELEKELSSTREALRQTEREAVLGEVVLSVAHQIKNPLGPMKGYAQMMSTELDQVEPVERRERLGKGLRVILEEVERIDRQVRELLTFAGRKTPRRDRVDVSRLLDRAVHFVSPETRGVRVEMDIGSPLPEVIGDADRLHGAFLNLILNAVEAMSETPCKVLRVSAHPRDGGLAIGIADTGVGISPEDLEQIYEPFFSRRKGGFGLGLPIVRSVASECGGTLTCISSPGTGTEFRVQLPAAEDEENQDA